MSSSGISFDLLKCPLDGANLIEASAGTGKTYALSGLYLRLLLERELTVSQVLVVTFTEAATEELKARIREKLRQGLAEAEGMDSGEPFIKDLIAARTQSARTIWLLKRALRSFDEAAISTIHGFCHRVLRENAFESGSPFEIEIVPDESVLLKALVQDYWRKKLPSLSMPFVQFWEESGSSVMELLKLATRFFGRPGARLTPRPEMPCCRVLERELADSYRRLRDSWLKHAGWIQEVLQDVSTFKQNTYRKSSVGTWLQELGAYLGVADESSSGEEFSRYDPDLALVMKASQDLPEKFHKFTQSAINGGVKKKIEPPRHPFFELCEQVLSRHESLISCYGQARLALISELFDHLASDLKSWKARSGARSYGDLLTEVRDALFGNTGGNLAGILRDRYRAALIDEFQDTDPVQYDIFNRLFRTDQHSLFLIGDPKQAIYGFRGADIFAYLQASNTIERKFYLTHNWRSDPGLIRSCNELFGNNRAPFVFPEIQFNPVQAAERDRDILTEGAKPATPMELWWVDAEKVSDSGKPNKADVENVIYRAVGGEIARLIGLGRRRKLMLGEAPLQEQDIAVLVRTNAQAARLQEALKRLSVPSVLYQTGDLLATREAREMQWLLAGILEPTREKLVRTALATSMIGCSAAELDRLQTDEAAWEEWMTVIQGYRDRWLRSGFMHMFKSILNDQQTLPRLMRSNDGERMVTNFQHLAEVLHRESQQQGLGPAELLKWLADRRNGAQPGQEEHLLRMETDESAVRIITMHKSKGLEFPVVFCPFCWDSVRQPTKNDPVLCHDMEERSSLIMDLGSDQRERRARLAASEELAESLRLLYVALTRARNRCYLVWGKLPQSGLSAPAYLFHGPFRPQENPTSPAPNLDTLSADLAAYFGRWEGEELLQHLQDLEQLAEGGLFLREVPLSPGISPPAATPPDEQLRCRSFHGRLDRSWRLASFSSLASGRSEAPEAAADRDQTVTMVTQPEPVRREPETEAKSLDMFSFPKGARAGTVLHDIFEQLDFEGDPEIAGRQVVKTALARYGFDPVWEDPVLDMVTRVLSAPLTVARPDLMLKRIPSAERLSELEFHFPMGAVRADRLNEFLGRYLAFIRKPMIPLPPGGERLGEGEEFQMVTPSPRPSPSREREFGDGRYLLGQRAVEVPEQIGRLNFNPVKGFMKGFIDLVFRFDGRFYVVDWKSNFLGDQPDHYHQKAMTGVMMEHFYTLQYLIYTVAVDRYLSFRLPSYHYDTHFGGVFYIFLRGVDPGRGPDYGIYEERPDAVRIRELREVLQISPTETGA